MKRETWKVVVKGLVPQNSNVINGILVTVTKEVKNDKPYLNYIFAAKVR